jgi:hypothetical protein
MAFSIKKTDIIDYPPEALTTFHLESYEWIDNLNFTLNPKDCLSNANAYIKVAKEMFLNKGGWDGDGEIALMWIPPFMIPYDSTKKFFNGVVIWHVKQKEDGISWILTPIDLPFLNHGAHFQ